MIVSDSNSRKKSPKIKFLCIFTYLFIPVHRFSIAKHRKRRSDIIIEDSIPDLSTLFMMLGKLSTPN